MELVLSQNTLPEAVPVESFRTGTAGAIHEYNARMYNYIHIIFTRIKLRILISLLKTIHVSETFNDSRLLFVLVFSPVLPLKSQTLEAFVQLRELTASISVLESGIANLQGDVKELQEPSVNEIAKWHAVKHLWGYKIYTSFGETWVIFNGRIARLLWRSWFRLLMEELTIPVQKSES